MFKMSWSQRGHDIYIVLHSTEHAMEFDKVEVCMTDQACVLRLPDGRKHGWLFFLDVNSKQSHRLQNKECLVIVVQKKDTTIFWPSFKRQRNTNLYQAAPDLESLPPVDSYPPTSSSASSSAEDEESSGSGTSSFADQKSADSDSSDGQPKPKMANMAGTPPEMKKISEQDKAHMQQLREQQEHEHNIKSSCQQSSMMSGGTLMGGNRNSNNIHHRHTSDNLQSVASKLLEEGAGDNNEEDGNDDDRRNSENGDGQQPLLINLDSVKSDCYQKEDVVVVMFYIPLIDPASIKIHYQECKFAVTFRTGDNKLHTSLKTEKNTELKLVVELSGCVESDSCKHVVTSKRLQVVLHKTTKKLWTSIFKPKVDLDAKKNNKASSPVKKEKVPGHFTNHPEGGMSLSKVCEPGFTGLSNLGNTCFFNSVLQALVNVAELKDYFISRDFERDLNRKNPLGMGGKVAECFHRVVDALWSGNMKSFAPSLLRDVIGSKEMRFNDYRQHDAQEFMAFLLDLLHEDLNRVYQKPYYEIKEGAGRNDHVVAEESWKLHKSRNDSKIVDLFHGLYKSRLVCPDCGKNSVKFDPFLFLPLPMPKQTRGIWVICQLADPSLLPVKLRAQVQCERPLAGEVFKQACAVLHVPQANWRMFHVMESKIQRFFIPNSELGNITDKSLLFLQEGLILDPDVSHPCWEVVVFQRRLEVHPANVCVHCKKKSEQSTAAIKRCTKCLTVAYCNQQCQRADWPRHKFNCRRNYEGIAYPVVVRIPKLKWTFVDLCNNLTRVAMNRVVDVKFLRSCDGEEVTPAQLTTRFDDFPLEFKPFEPSRMNNSSCTTPLHDQGNEVIDLSKIKFLAMDWLCEPTRPIYAEVQAKKMEFSRVMEVEGGSGENLHLHDCINLFTEPEVLAPEEAWYCPDCKRHVEATKELSLWSLPDVLIIQLKRFSFKHNLWRDKIDRFVDFPKSGLDMTSYCIGGEGAESKCVYDLFAVVNHNGNILGGHYTCVVRMSNSPTNRSDTLDDLEWRICDDSHVRRVTSQSVVSDAAYVMFYRKRTNTSANLTMTKSPVANGEDNVDNKCHQQQQQEETNNNNNNKRKIATATRDSPTTSVSAEDDDSNNRKRTNQQQQQQLSSLKTCRNGAAPSTDHMTPSTSSSSPSSNLIGSPNPGHVMMGNDMEGGKLCGERMLRYDEVFNSKGDLVLNNNEDSDDDYFDASSSSDSSSYDSTREHCYDDNDDELQENLSDKFKNINSSDSDEVSNQQQQQQEAESHDSSSSSRQNDSKEVETDCGKGGGDTDAYTDMDAID